MFLLLSVVSARHNEHNNLTIDLSTINRLSIRLLLSYFSILNPKPLARPETSSICYINLLLLPLKYKLFQTEWSSLFLGDT